MIIYRDATERDTALILHFIRELAEYEKLLHEVVATEEDIRSTLFCANPKVFAVIAERDGQPAGFTLCFYNYSTFQGRFGIYIEDLYVREDCRGMGIGKGFFHYIAQKALAENCGRIQWWVLNWNEPSIAFYRKMGATCMDEWSVFRLEGKAIENLAFSPAGKVEKGVAG